MWCPTNSYNAGIPEPQGKVSTSKVSKSGQPEDMTRPLKPYGGEYTSSNDIESESEDDTEPEELVKKYLSLQSRIFEIYPEGCSLVGGKKSSKFKTSSNGEMIEKSPELANLYRKVEKIESDILFDQSEASAQWLATRNQLARDLAERKKYQLDTAFHAQGSAVIKSSSKNPDNTTAHDEDDNIFMFGDMFTDLSQQLTTLGVNSASSMGENNDGKTVTIRDFGKWTGVNPRRIFENSCKSRLDPFAAPLWLSLAHDLTETLPVK